MVKPNYSFEKRQRELTKKKKKEEKLRDKTERKVNSSVPFQGQSESDSTAPGFISGASEPGI